MRGTTASCVGREEVAPSDVVEGGVDVGPRLPEHPASGAGEELEGVAVDGARRQPCGSPKTRSARIWRWIS